MPRINFVDSGHQLPAPIGGARFQPFIRAADGPKIRLLEAAMRFIESQLVQTRTDSCESAFHSHSEGRGFAEVWADPDIWISYSLATHARGLTHYNGRDIALSITAFGDQTIQWRPVAATLIHELAHANGAPRNTHEAERAVRVCRFADQYDPSLVG